MENNDNRQILVIQDGEEQKPSKWSMKKYGQSIKKYKWWVTGVTVGLALAALLGVQYGYNASKAKFDAQFSYNLPLNIDESTGNGTYVDGSSFKYYDIISEENLKTVKESNEKFASLDVDKIAKSGAISISVNGRTDSDTEVFTITTPVTYTISGTLKSFGDSSTAKDFVKALIELTKSKASEAVNSYTVVNLIPEDSIFNNLDFDRQISIMLSQYSRVLSTYDGLLASYSDNNIIKGSDTELLEVIRNNYLLSYVDGDKSAFTVLSNKLEDKSYVNYDASNPQKTIDTLIELGESDIKNIKKNLQNINLIQDALSQLDVSSDTTYGDNSIQQKIAAYNQSILDLKTANNEYVEELEELGYNVPDTITLDNVESIDTVGGDGKIQKLQAVIDDTDEGKAWAEENATFKASIDSYKDQLVADTEAGSKVARYVYTYNRNSVTYVYAGIISTSGGFSAWIGAIVGLLVGFLASSLICCSIYINKEDDDDNKAVKKAE